MKRQLLFLWQILFLALLLIPSLTKGQSTIGRGKISGDFSFSGMYYLPDSLINATEAEEKVRANTYLNLLYTNANFSVGARYEFYLFPLIDFEQIGYKGQGITYFFADYKNDFLQVTAGSFYEQFGNGFTLRAYEDRALGIDNSLYGARVKVTPYSGINIKAIWGIQRKNFDFNFMDRKDFVRGGDMEVVFDEIFPKMSERGFSTSVGGSFVSKYENPKDVTLKLPANVGVWSLRFLFRYKGFRIESEYANKINDPNLGNGFIYKNGEALFITTSYSQKGLGVSLSFIRTDNMDFRSQRNTPNTTPLLQINNMPSINHQYTYALLGNYSFVSQPNGEIGLQLQANYNIPKKTKIGGKYGTDLTIHYSRLHDIDKQFVAASDSLGSLKGTDGYTSHFLKFGKNLLYQDIGFEMSRRLNSHWKLGLEYNFLTYNLHLLQGEADTNLFKGHHAGVEVQYKINSRHALRFNAQHLYSKQDMGSWLHLLIEYSISPHWFFSVADAWNYGNSQKEKKIHYFNVAATYIIKTTRISLQYGKTREGILCSGGVCRTVPASYGVGLSVITSF